MTLPNISLSTANGRLRVEFYWHQDRFVHRLWLDDVESGHSIDGDGETDWPPSPPIQQLSLEEIGRGKAILGVGGAGRGHWSISVEAVNEDTLKFDLACRCRGVAGSLGSEYSSSDRLEVHSIHGRLVSPPDRAQVAPVTTEPDASGSPSGQATHRWTYQVKPA